LRNKVHYTLLNQINSVHTPKPYFHAIQFTCSLVLKFMPISPK
jgi:hypothetical protein